jgi:hypothetical protein
MRSRQWRHEKAYQNIKQGSFETLAQYSERFRETYRAFQDSTSTDVSVEEADQAMDFFYGLDPVRYGLFKTNMINGWTTGAFRPPSTVNEIYRVAGFLGQANFQVRRRNFSHLCYD